MGTPASSAISSEPTPLLAGAAVPCFFVVTLMVNCITYLHYLLLPVILLPVRYSRLSIRTLHPPPLVILHRSRLNVPMTLAPIHTVLTERHHPSTTRLPPFNRLPSATNYFLRMHLSEAQSLLTRHHFIHHRPWSNPERHRH